MTNYRIDANIDTGGITGLGSTAYGGNGYLEYKVVNDSGNTVIAYTNIGIKEIDTGLYTVVGGIEVPYGDTYFVRWYNTNTNQSYGGLPTQYNNQVSDIFLGVTPAAIVTALLNAISVYNTPTIVSSLGTYFVITSTYSANLPGFADFIIQQGSLYPVFSAACYYQGTQIQIASAIFRVWSDGNELTNLVDAVMTVNSDYSVTYDWQAGDLPLPGDYQFQIIATDLNGETVPVPLTKNGLLTVTPKY